jgi:hypothetical protein
MHEKRNHLVYDDNGNLLEAKMPGNITSYSYNPLNQYLPEPMHGPGLQLYLDAAVCNFGNYPAEMDSIVNM